VVLPNITNPQDLNRYSYVANNPLGHIDASGRQGPLVVVEVPAGVVIYTWVALVAAVGLTEATRIIIENPDLVFDTARDLHRMAKGSVEETIERLNDAYAKARRGEVDFAGYDPGNKGGRGPKGFWKKVAAPIVLAGTAVAKLVEDLLPPKGNDPGTGQPDLPVEQKPTVQPMTKQGPTLAPSPAPMITGSTPDQPRNSYMSSEQLLVLEATLAASGWSPEDIFDWLN
jgi:hypothetical protein